MFSRVAQQAQVAARSGVRYASTLNAESHATSNQFKAVRDATKAHAHGTTDLWRKISFYVCIPGIFVGAIWVKQVEDQHHAHMAHLKEENGGEAPARPVYSYMNIRNKPFPWGNQSLFFNPEVNIPAGEQ